MSKDNKVFQFPNKNGLPTPLTSEQFKKNLQQMKDDLPNLFEFYEIQAKITRKRYESLRAEGFTPEEALALCSV